MFHSIAQGLCGYLFQLLPCTFFCLYPFYDNFRHARKRVLASMAGILSVMAAVFTYVFAALYIPSGGDGRFRVALTLIFLLSVLFLLFVYLFLIRARAAHKFFVFTLVLNYGFLLTESVTWVGDFFPSTADGYLYNTPYLFLHLIFNAILFYPMLTLLHRTRHMFQSPIISDVWRWISLIPFTFFLGLLLFYELPSNSGMSSDRILSLFARVMELLMLVACYVILHILDTVRRMTAERISLEAAVESYRSAAATAEKEREARHEFRHHLAALSILLQNKDYAGASDYLEKVSQTAIQTSPNRYTPHVLLNSMLSEYEKQAAAIGATVSYSISAPGPIQIDDLDLCQFLSNLMDNALEATFLLPPEKRRISLKIRQNGNFLCFLCENSCDTMRLRSADGSFSTTKREKSSHGYGIAIMRRIAEKYNGVLHIQAKNNTFITAVNLCMSSTPPNSLVCAAPDFQIYPAASGI